MTDRSFPRLHSTFYGPLVYRDERTAKCVVRNSGFAALVDPLAVMAAALALLCSTIAPGHAQDDADRYWRAVMGPSVLTPAQEQAAESGAEFTECANGCPTMIVVPAGSYMMGSPATETDRSANEGPQHRVTIAKPFAVGKTEVTFAQWEACVAAAACRGGTCS